MEIERKWLVEAPPPGAVLAGDAEPIDQGYLVLGEDGAEARLRRRAGRHTLTVKAGRGIEREELEVALTPEQFDTLWPGTEGRRLEKTRRVIPAEGGLSIELDEYAGRLAGLRVAEVEFDDVGAARAFAPPAWFGREVTDDDAYRNRSLALRGDPSGYDPSP